MKKILLFCGLAVSVLFPLSFLPAAETDTVQKLSDDTAGFRKIGVRRFLTGYSAVFRAPSGLIFYVYSWNPGKKDLSNDIHEKTNRILLEKSFEELCRGLKKIKLKDGRPVEVIRVFSKEETFSCLAGRRITGIRQQFTFAKNAGDFRCDSFMTVYRGNLFRIMFTASDHRIRQEVHDKLFRHIASAVFAQFYAGEKTEIPAVQKEIVLRAFGKLMNDPLHSMEEAHALIAFADRSPMVIVNINENDLPWQKSLTKGTPAEQKYADLLLASYAGGNAAAQLKEGCCADRRNAGIHAIKQLYKKLRQTDPKLFIPELEGGK